MQQLDTDILELRAELWGSFILFCQYFFPLVTGREFHLSSPICRESHFITLARELTKLKRLDMLFEVITIPPGHAKSTMLCLWVAWTISEFPDSQYLYISYGHEIAAKHTEFIRRIIQLPQYFKIFGVAIRHDMKAKDHFVTTQGGSVKAFGSSGPITGQDAGLPNLARFSGAVIMDDMHKPDEVHSDSIREGVIQNFQETISQRPRGPLVPMIFLGQRLHEADLPAFLLSGDDERTWQSVVLQSIDGAGNALYPEVNPLAELLQKREKNPYVFSSQYQQEPVPAGGALFKERDLVLLDDEPEFLMTFLTADTAETSKTYNDATAFSFWGLYYLQYNEQQTRELALHWIDCWEFRVEPKELEGKFWDFYGETMLHKTKPRVALIEKKSTGVTLASVLSDARGLDIRDVKRTRASGSKADRYLEMQPIINSKLVSMTNGAPHVARVVAHMLKITANMTHQHDDICDTCYDAIKAALIDKSLYLANERTDTHAKVSQANAKAYNQRLQMLKASRGY